MPQDQPARPAPKVRKAMSALLVQLARLDPPAPQVHRAALELQALLDPQERLAPKATRARKARSGLLEVPALKVRSVQRAPLERKATPGRKARKV